MSEAAYVVEAGTPADMQAIRDLIVELAVYEKEEQEVEVTAEQLVRDGFEHKLFSTFVAKEASSGKVVGFALYYKRYSTWKGMTLYLEDLYITEAHRRNGVGLLLFDALVKVCKAEDAGRLEWQCLEWNELAIGFYKSKVKALIDPAWLNCKLDKKLIQEW